MFLHQYDIRDYWEQNALSLAKDYYDKTINDVDALEELLEHDTGFSEYVDEAFNNACLGQEAKEESLRD